MKITIIQVGKTKTSSFQQLEAEYLKRLQPDANIQIVTIKEEKIAKNAGEKERETVKKAESERILAQLPQDSTIIALEEAGKQFTSPQFADFLADFRNQGTPITFIIGGTYGLYRDVRNTADYHLALSKMTFTHEMVRTVLLEQIYRGISILKGKTYHY